MSQAPIRGGRLSHVLRQIEHRLADADSDGSGSGLDPTHSGALSSILSNLRPTQMYTRIEIMLQVFDELGCFLSMHSHVCL